MITVRSALSAATALAVAVVGTTALASAASAAPETASPALVGEAPGASGTNIVENFDTVPPAGWNRVSKSNPAGSNPLWFQGNPPIDGGPFAAHEGADNAYAAANYNATAGDNGTISTWLITPVIGGISGGDVVSFYTRKHDIGSDYPDRMEVRLATGSACNPDAGGTQVGDFTTLLTSINPNLVLGGYPRQWTEYSLTVPSMAPTSGCIAFRYFVTAAGPTGTNSDYIGVDTFRYTHQPDPVVPDTAITDLSGAPGNNVSATFNGTPSYAIDHHECSFDGSPFTTCTSPVTYTDLLDGEHSLLIRAVTAAGTVDPTPAVRTFTVDTTAPDVAINTAPVGVTSSAAVEVTFSSPEEDATFECRLDDGAWAACTSPVSFTDLLDGAHTVAVRATDAVGNTSEPVTTHFDVDTAAPGLSIDSAPVSTVTTTSASFEFASADEHASFQCKLDDAAWAACTSPASFTELAQGEHTVSIRAIDPAGNASPAIPTSFTVDSVAPIVTITSAPTGVVATGSAAVAFSANEAATFECQLDDAAWAACTSPATFAGLTDGAHTVNVRATDTAGHIGDVASVSFTAKRAAVGPTLTKITLTAPKQVRTKKNFKATITGLVPGAKLTITWAGKKKTYTATGTKKVITLKAPQVKKTKKLTLKATATKAGKKASATTRIKVRR